MSEPNRIAGHLVGVRRVGELVGVGQTPTADVRNLVGRNNLNDDNDRNAPHFVTGPRFPGVVRTHGSRRLTFTYDLSSGSCETRGTMIFDARGLGCSSSRGYSGKARCSRRLPPHERLREVSPWPGAPPYTGMSRCALLVDTNL